MPENLSDVPENISRRIQAIRYFGILGVVFCHAVQIPFFFLNGTYFHSQYYYLFASNALVRFTHSLVIYGLFYGAVPMFFVFSGYLQFCRPRPYGETVVRRVRTLLLPMALWTIFSVAAFFLLKAGKGVAFYPDLLSGADRDWFHALVGNYSRAWMRGTHCPKVMFQFWFIRDLFVLTLFSPAIGFLMREWKRGVFFLVVSGAVLAAGYRPVVAGGDSLFYFSLGVFFALQKVDFFSGLDRFWNWGFAVALAVGAVSWMRFKYDGNPDPDTPMWVQLSSTLLLMKFSGVIAAKERAFKIAQLLDTQAFFLYCAHAPFMISLCAYINYELLPDTAGPSLVVASLFFIGVADAALCTAAGFLLKRFCPGVFALLTGGRKQVNCKK